MKTFFFDPTLAPSVDEVSCSARCLATLLFLKQARSSMSDEPNRRFVTSKLCGREGEVPHDQNTHSASPRALAPTSKNRRPASSNLSANTSSLKIPISPPSPIFGATYCLRRAAAGADDRPRD